MLKISYETTGMRARFSCDLSQARSEWFPLLRRTLEDHTEDLFFDEQNSFSVPWWSFLNARGQVIQIIKAFNVDYELEPTARQYLETARSRLSDYHQAKRAVSIPDGELLKRIKAAGFKRELKEYQLQNICRLAALSAAATFSVPGAGKTSEALAYYLYRSQSSDHLLVISPKNAFTAWDEQLVECMGKGYAEFLRLRGGYDRISAQLQSKPRFMLITYQQLTQVQDLISSFVAANPTYVFLDESHRIKSGTGFPTANAVLRLSHLPVGKLIMSGTPMPQSKDDLLPQFEFLYPEIRIDTKSVVELIKPVYVRTTKSDLGLEPPKRYFIPIELREYQNKLYSLMKYEVARLADQTLSMGNRQAFRALGKSIMRLLQVVSNPALLAKEIGFAHEGMLMAVLEEGDSPKVSWAIQRARQLASEGKKTIIWTTFRENVEIIAQRLTDLKAVFIHGSVDAGDENDEETREGRIRLFHDDKDTFVMVANPAAAAEGISLHKVCHHAIYVDRTYNAAHYLQSEDRIHRLGLEQGQTTTIEILECTGTIDESVRIRLSEKVQAMADVLNDKSLHIDPIKLDQFDIDDEVEGEVGKLDEGDVRNLLENIRRNNN